MKAGIAVATVSGRAYYTIVSALKEKGISFLSLIPNEPIPVEVKAVLTTEKEKHLINHDKVLVYEDGADLEVIVNSAVQAALGKTDYEKLVIGIDPGEAIGLAVLADGKIIETGNCFSVSETLERIRSILRNLRNISIASASVKVGNGAREFKEDLLHALDESLPLSVRLESVGEAGTSTYQNEAKHRRELKDIVSAIKIAGRNGNAFQRRRSDGSNRRDREDSSS